MRAMRKNTIGLMTALCLLTAFSWAAGPGALPKMSAPPAKMEALTSLGAVKTFDVHDIERAEFSAAREGVPPEIAEYARAAIRNDKRFRYDSPAGGILSFHCADAGCHWVRAQVNAGQDGPVVWQTTKLFKTYSFLSFTFMPDTRNFANKIVTRLAQDYQKSSRQYPARLQIHEE